MSKKTRKLIQNDVEMAASNRAILVIRKALIEGENSGDAGNLDMKAIEAKARKKVGLAPTGA